MERGPPDVELPGPVDGPGAVDVIILPFRFQSCTGKKRHLSIICDLLKPSTFYAVRQPSRAPT